jgi:hypothetical protein
MDLKDFVKESLVQISQGISEANIALEGTGAVINPQNIRINSENSQAYGRTDFSAKEDPRSRVVEKVDFDVSVVVEQGEQTKAGIKLSVASIGLGAGGQSSSADRSESRIKFSVPVVFPSASST